MNHLKKICSLIFLIFISCKEEFVCEDGVSCPETIAEQNNDSESPDTSEINNDEDQVFTDSEGQTYYMGFDCGTPSGQYGFPSEESKLNDLVIPDNLPIDFDLSQYLPPVESQGVQPSCVSWAVTYYMKSMQEKIQFDHDFNSSTIMSPAYTYNQLSKGYCTGTSIEATLDILIEKGALTLDEFPYVELECHKLPSEEQDGLAAVSKISDYKTLSGTNMVAEMKTLITQKHPIIIAAVLDAEFGKKDSFGISAYREHVTVYEGAGCHAMLVVGYSDFYNAFKVVNSWGKNWGDEGFVWIDYKAFENVSKASEAFKVITSAIVAYDTI